MLTLEFKWYRDSKGYRLIPAKPIRVRPGQSLLDVPVADIQPARIVLKGGALQPYRPLEIERLFERFIDMCDSDEGVLKFVEKYGPLTHQGLREGGDIVPEMTWQAEEMSQAMRGQIAAMPLSKLNATIVTDHRGMRLKVSPACLLDALWLQLAQAKSVSNFRECPQCARSFITGRGGSRRADARFCSVECKTKYFSLKRSQRNA